MLNLIDKKDHSRALRRTRRYARRNARVRVFQTRNMTALVA